MRECHHLGISSSEVIHANINFARRHEKCHKHMHDVVAREAREAGMGHRCVRYATYTRTADSSYRQRERELSVPRGRHYGRNTDESIPRSDGHIDRLVWCRCFSTKHVEKRSIKSFLRRFPPAFGTFAIPTILGRSLAVGTRSTPRNEGSQCLCLGCTVWSSRS